MTLFPSTSEKLKDGGKKILAAFSIISFCAFLGLLPVTLVTPINQSMFWFLVSMGYFLIYIIVIPALVFGAKLLNIQEDLFNDYANWSALFHWGLIILSLLAIMFLEMAKIIVFFRELRYKNNIAPTDYGR